MRAIILVDHGSRRARANDKLLEIAAGLRQELAREGRPDLVKPAHMEIAEPTIAQAFDQCLAGGATELVVVPCMISRGRHVTEDIPKLLELAAQRHPAVRFRLAAPLSEHAGFLSLLLQAADST